ncbi:hypothetical protein [Micromonospora sp. B9E7]
MWDRALPSFVVRAAGGGSVIAAALATAPGSAGLWWLLRDWLRNRRE